jgi:hypothetical protein
MAEQIGTPSLLTMRTNLQRFDPISMADSQLHNRLAALQLVVLSLPRAPAVLLRSGTLLALGSGHLSGALRQWRESESTGQ